MSKEYDEFIRLLTSAIPNVTQSFYDSYVEKNTSLRARAGVKCYIIRRQMGRCCDWCASLAGIYEEGDAPDGIYQRHKNCKCLVTFRSEKGTYEDVWSKREFETQRAARLAKEKELLAAQVNPRLKVKIKKIKKVDFYTGLNGVTITENYSEWIGDNEMEELLRKAESDELKIYIRSDYRKKSFIGDGSTAAIREFEIKTGLKCGRNGGTHEKKVSDLIRQIEKIDLNTLPDSDKIYLEKMLKRLKRL